MNIFSLILAMLSVVYLFLGLSVIRLDQKSTLNRLFFALNLSLVIWSFTAALYLSADDEATCIFWFKLSSIGALLFVGIVLHFFLKYTHKEKLLKQWWVYIVLYLPSIIFSYMQMTSDFFVKAYFHGSNGWIISARTDSLWFWASIAYTIVYVGVCVLISYRYQKTAISQRERKQARILIVSSAASLLTGMIIDVFTFILRSDIPDISTIAGAVWSVGIYYAIVKYKLMAMTPALIAENLFQTIIDSVILTDPKGIILSVNPETQKLLGYNQKELVGEPLERIFFSDSQSNNANISELLNTCPVRGVEASIISKNGVKIPIILSISECEDNYDTRIGFVLASKDVTEYKNAEKKIQYLATHDSLTGLPNRLLFTQLLHHAIQSAKRHKQQLAVFFIDLDRFKIINDTKGHAAGDQLLQEIATRYKHSLRASDVVSRQGGDEFVILIEDVHKLGDLELVAANILASTLKPVVLLDDECRVTASIGISLYPKDGDDEQSLMKNADIAMYYAKEEGKNNFQFYSKDIQSQSTGRLAIETNLRYALERNELYLHYQAKTDVKTGIITGVEALLRWQSPILGAVTPTQLIPVAEATGMIIPIGKWVLKTACAQNVAWQKEGLPAVCMAVNLSLRQIADDNLIDDIKAALNDSGLAANLLELEITESTIMSNPTRMLAVLVKIKSLGVRLSIDDFGTGYSSLSKLKHFPIDTLKIDRSFVRNIPENAEDKAITHAIIAMGRNLGLTVIAEGVETVEQLNFLKEQSCDEMQGYFFSKPIEPERFADLLRDMSTLRQ
ncbi:EAL domain-containing protein [Acetobacterium sp.]|uniref:EAL domain-containing protein n=1 Tax=Acetobacterium sp. TaxID=1872094 RepID=UPI002F41C743